MSGIRFGRGIGEKNPERPSPKDTHRFVIVRAGVVLVRCKRLEEADRRLKDFPGAVVEKR